MKKTKTLKPKTFYVPVDVSLQVEVLAHNDNEARASAESLVIERFSSQTNVKVDIVEAFEPEDFVN